MLFDRETRLAVGPEGEQGREWGETLRVSWSVQHKRSSDPSTAKIELYNPDPDSIDYIRNGRKVVRLKTGLRDPVQIFIGYIKDGGTNLEFDEGDRKLTIEATDKAYEGQKKHIDKKIPSQTDIQKAIREIANEADIPIETLDFGNVGRPKLQATMVISESVQQAFDKLAQRAGVDIWTKDGKLVAAQRGKSPRSAKVVEFSQENKTLFGVDPMKKGRIKVTALLRPQIRPGDLFSLEHDRYGGGWRARDVSFRGDSGWEKSYEIEITAEPR